MIYDQIVNLLVCIFEAVIAMTFFTSYGDKRRGFIFWEYALGTLIMGLSIRAINAFLYLRALNLILIILAIAAVFFYYSLNTKRNLILSIFSVVIMSLSEIIVIFIMTFIMGISAGEITSVTEYSLLGTVLSKLLAFMIVKIICMLHKESVGYSGKTSYWILFLSIFLINVVTSYLLYIFQYKNPGGGIYNTLAVLCSFGLLYASFFVLYLYESIIKQSQEEYRREIFRQQEKEQAKYIEEIMSSQNKIRKLRHDLKNHNIALRAYFESGDTEAGLKYLDNLDKMTMEMSPGSVNTGNIVLDALVNNKQRIAEEKNIKFTAFLQIPDKLFIDSTDICIIFGNALDNAIEACEKIKGSERRISLHVVYENDSLICKFENTAPEEIGHDLKTTKKNEKEHGFGIGNIETALSKYDSIYKFSQKDSIFTLSIVIYRE